MSGFSNNFIFSCVRIEMVPTDQIEKVPFFLQRLYFHTLTKSRFGVILNVNSGVGKTGFSDLSSYCASKFGLVGLGESLALEVAAYNISVNHISWTGSYKNVAGLW